jgi:hypothetical protein
MATISNPDPKRSVRPFDLAALALTGLFTGGLLGAVTNAVSGALSPGYFVTVLGWRNVEYVWVASIAHGIFEGLIVGLIFSTVFAISASLISGGSCPYSFSARHLAGIAGAALVCWLIGGVLGIGLAALSPDFYCETFRGVPDEFGPMLAFAWVGGSIWGIEFGGFASLLLGIAIFRANWHNHLQSSTDDGSKT